MLHDPTLAIESVLSEDVRDAILDGLPPNLRGATVADVLDIADQHDHGLEHLEPAWAAWGQEVCVLVGRAHQHLSRGDLVRLVNLSMLTFVLTPDLPLAEDRVRDLASDAAARMESLAATA